MSDVFVQSLGTCLPERVSVEWAMEQGLCGDGTLNIAQLTGALVAGETSAAEMTVTAAGRALARAGLTSADLDALIHSSVFEPGPAGWSMPGYTLRELGGGSAMVSELRTGCGGSLNAIQLATGQLTGDQGLRHVLITAADNFEPWVQRWNSFAFIVGDAGSAALLSATGGFARVKAINSRTMPELEAMYRGAEPLFPPSAGGRPIDENARFDVFTEQVMPALEVGAIMASTHAELARLSAKDAGIEVDGFARVITHNMAAFTVERFFMEPMGLPMDRSCFEFGRGLGHLGCSDQVTSLEHLLTGGELSPGDHVLLIGGSAGFATTAIVLEILEIPDWVSPTPGKG
ncbi:ketoacyl-ACP synthase III family protein [Amycolatopsis xylanica]|uniref:ketoacyl-ACP synthase III family protein n=1 Tax=Amycolatopsis xylanica TaxID=589385 RepID=UPI00115FBB9E|nr:ketoacyl-ACP synthase III family protein [Amycolatopsis xylanica]